MDAIGGAGVAGPVLTPVELWEATGRDTIPEIFHVTDRAGRRFILPMTHEETFTFHAREIQSYKELPQLWYHFSDQGPRRAAAARRAPPRARVHHEGRLLVRPRPGRRRGELRAVPRGLRPDLRAVRSRGRRRPGGERDHGREADVDYLAPSGSGENTLVRVRARRLRRRRRDRPRRSPPARASRRGSTRRRRSRRPASRRSKGSRSFLGIDAAATSKAMPVDEGRRPRRARARPRRRPAQRGRSSSARSAATRGPRPTRRFAPRSAPSGGSLGPVGFEGEVLADETLREGQFVAGANRDGCHLRGVEAGRDYQPRFADIREPHEGDRCPECGGALTFQTAIEVGHIFNFGDEVQRAPRRDVPRRGRNGEALRSVAATESVPGA